MKQRTICMVARDIYYKRWTKQIQTFAPLVHDIDAPLENCWGFVDGTVRGVCKLGLINEVHVTVIKKSMPLNSIHLLHLGSWLAYGQVEDWRYDSTVMARYKLLSLL